MHKGSSWCLVFIVFAVFHARAAAQGEPASFPSFSLEDERECRAKVTLEGFVLAPDGSPAEGAVVVSSAGGRVITDASGNYRLAVELPLAAASVQVTAASSSGRSSFASTRVALSGASRTLRVPPLGLAVGASCSPSWLPTFGGEPGTDDGIGALAVYDDGSGPALYAGGPFTSAGGVAANSIAKWDGASWTALASGIGGTVVFVEALTVFDDGNGPALYAGGSFTTAGGVPANRIAKWDGSSWAALGSGMNAAVLSLAAYDDGTGFALYAGGEFTTAGGVAVNRIAKWDGTSWTALGSGVSGGTVTPVVHALAVYDDGGGPALYAGGRFLQAGGVPAARVAKWNGSNWSGLQSPVDGVVHALTVLDLGSGPALYAGGEFATAGGVPASRIAKWDGTSWAALASGMDGNVLTLAVYDDGGGPALYASGYFTIAGGVAASRIAKWDGTSWAALASGISGSALGLTVFDDGGGPALYAGGAFRTAGGVPANRIAKWNGASWAALGSGLNESVLALKVHDDGDGPALFVGGAFTTTGQVETDHIAKWDGASWSALGSGTDNLVYALEVYDDGGGPALYAGGSFTAAGGTQTSGVAKWDGTSWSALGSGTNSIVRALQVYDDGGGLALYAGGGFTAAGGVAANRVAKWDGASWSALGSGTNSWVFALAVYDDGNGPALYAGGDFTTAGGVAASRIARWDGTSWSPLGSGMASPNPTVVVYALAEHDDGSGSALYAAGEFNSAGGVVARRIARWNGASWSALVNPVDGTIRALAVLDLGTGPALYAGGGFTSAGGVAANSIAKWDGTSWSPLGSGILFRSGENGVQALVAYDDGGGPALHAGGQFHVTPDSGDSYLAKWGCPDSVPPTITCPPPLYVPDRLLDGQEVVHFTVTATDAVDPAPVVVCTPPSGSTFPLGTTLVTCTATDALGNQSTCQFPVTVSLKARRR